MRLGPPAARRAGAAGAAAGGAGDRPVRVVGWCLGGILSLLAHAWDADLPVEAAALVASPWDFSKVPLIAPLRPIDAMTRGWLVTQLYRGMGGAPAQIEAVDAFMDRMTPGAPSASSTTASSARTTSRTGGSPSPTGRSTSPTR